MTQAESYQQLKLCFTDPLQQQYEVIRPVVLFAETVSEWSRQIDIDRTVIGERARRLLAQGMVGLLAQHVPHSSQFPNSLLSFEVLLLSA